MKDIKLEILGIGIILLEIAISTNNFFGYVGEDNIIALTCFYKYK